MKNSQESNDAKITESPIIPKDKQDEPKELSSNSKNINNLNSGISKLNINSEQENQPKKEMPIVYKDSESKNKLVFHLMNNIKSPIYNSECLSDIGKFNEVTIPASIIGNGIFLDFFNSQNKLVAEIPTNVEELIKKKPLMSSQINQKYTQ